MRKRTLNNAVAAGLWGLISAFSLFLGALVGISFKVSHQTNGLIMAFGAGALFFAVAIEMFAAGLREMEEDGDPLRMQILIFSSVVGAIFFVVVNRILTGGQSNSVVHQALHEEREKEEEVKRRSSIGGYAQVPAEEEQKEEVAGTGRAQEDKKSVAFSIWLGILIDGVPESMLIGFMQSEGTLSVAFIVAVFLANFPEAMSSSALMFRSGDPVWKILSMWSALFVGTGAVAFLTALIFPGHCHKGDEHSPKVCEFPYTVNIIASASEGLAGGSMMACISTAMLPESYEEGGDWAGLATLLGFLASLFVKLTMETHGEGHTVCAIECYDDEHMTEDFDRKYPKDQHLAGPLSWIHSDDPSNVDDF